MLFDIDMLDDFTLEVDIEFLRLERQVWFPKKIPREETLAKLLDCKETSDVTFVVEGCSFDLHKNVLFLKCKKLYEIANESSEKGDAIPIHSIKSDTFNRMIDYIYARRRPWLSYSPAKELLIAADRDDLVVNKRIAFGFSWTEHSVNAIAKATTRQHAKYQK